jgi:uncharacterized protein
VSAETPAAPPARRWPLRVGLGLALSALVIVGDRAYQSHPGAADSPSSTTSAPARPTTSVAGATTSAPTTTARRVAAVDHPIVNPGALDQRARGCGLHVTSTTTPSATTTTTRRVVGLGHCTVLEIGDSLGNDLGWGLARELAGVPGLHLIQEDKSSTGLTATWFFNWPHHLSADLRRYHPNLVIVCLGANDEQALAVKGVSRAFGSSSWASVYRTRIRRVTSLATAAGSYVLWVGLPIMEPAQYRRGVNFLNAQYRAVVPTIPGAAFQPTWDLLADAQGNFRAGGSVNGVQSALRAPDGIHFTVVGENVFATFVARQIATIYHVPLAPREPMYLAR